MEHIVVNVIGTQRDAGGEENRIELSTVGRHYEKNGITYIAYEETELSGMKGTTTLLKMYLDHLVVVRVGSIEHKQEFRLGQKTYSTYVTPYGNMQMSVYTTELNLAYPRMGISGSIYVKYELEIDGLWQSSNELSVNIREEHRNGY